MHAVDRRKDASLSGYAVHNKFYELLLILVNIKITGDFFVMTNQEIWLGSQVASTGQ